jgi:hypothetical protein
VGVAESNPIYQVLLCQTFHHIAVGMVNPLMGRFTFMPRFWNKNDTSVVGTLEGMPGPSREAIYAANIAHSVRPGPFGSLREQEQCVAVMLAALAQFKHVARSVVRKWCRK